MNKTVEIRSNWTSFQKFLRALEFHEGKTYASCISTGLYILQLDIDEAYICTPVLFAKGSV